MIYSCSFSSVCNAYDGGIVPSLNNPFASLAVSNTSFVGCCRTRNVECGGTADNIIKPDRQNETFNGANSFIWCEWNGSRTTGTENTWEDVASNGGAICMHSQSNASVSIKHCSFNDCYAHYDGGGVMCAKIKSVEIENNSFNSCTAQNQCGGGMCIYVISSCVRISGCEFRNCSAYGWGGGLYLENFQVSETGCIETENGEGESACVFDCSFTSCSVKNYYGGGFFCRYVPEQFKMRSIQFISCSALKEGGGFWLYPAQSKVPNDAFYCYFLFFHECNCSSNPPYGHDMIYYDNNNLYLSQNNPFKECYTTNTDDQRVCYGYDYSSSKSWKFQYTEKKDWLNEWSKILFVGVNGSDSSGLCGMGESAPCKTLRHAVETGLEELSSSITLMKGNHTSEATTIDIWTKKISVIGKGRTESSIRTGALSSIRTLFSVSTGHLGMRKLKIDCNSTEGTSPSMVVVSYRSGTLSLVSRSELGKL
ncbi:uncharacterized protein MONOS_16344 [Monocercomonoides exilis]|uniref:uncharacterized protein n=1 Tax=Monocercomonoides exilis TaxID=2049356 RepID=UPI0035599EAC|nr:hypothetical protein MONOS_16344 [Monocercomonoides exilis]